jgi:hypothetical protein
VVAPFLLRPFERRTWPIALQETQASYRAGFKRTANTAAIARLSDIRFDRRRSVKVNYLFVHIA